MKTPNFECTDAPQMLIEHPCQKRNIGGLGGWSGVTMTLLQEVLAARTFLAISWQQEPDV